jgi:hypothetical protein
MASSFRRLSSDSLRRADVRRAGLSPYGVWRFSSWRRFFSRRRVVVRFAVRRRGVVGGFAVLASPQRQHATMRGDVMSETQEYLMRELIASKVEAAILKAQLEQANKPKKPHINGQPKDVTVTAKRVEKEGVKYVEFSAKDAGICKKSVLAETELKEALALWKASAKARSVTENREGGYMVKDHKTGFPTQFVGVNLLRCYTN